MVQYWQHSLEGSQNPPNSSAKIQCNSLLEKFLSYFIYEQVRRNDAFIIQAALLQINFFINLKKNFPGATKRTTINDLVRQF